ncbi:hypothetical protein TU94_00405 [Streptomyces cyaneogriseus subsp. noncyanogenus]|uniref:Uncharacterized protein n=1 Tax=Streptomyces cyaneogriseus subsp. noncyanogenus TaxID=477245 RepID=A0A0C5FKI0_9ACTN|nr:hypothetical protein TU94_00405 [Streptomyces cyaneogriseus subsp. noncyanogenus]
MCTTQGCCSRPATTIRSRLVRETPVTRAGADAVAEAGPEEAAPIGDHDQLRPVACVELGHRAGEVAAHGQGAEDLQAVLAGVGQVVGLDLVGDRRRSRRLR